MEQYASGIFYNPEDKESFLRQINKLVVNDTKSLEQFKEGGKRLALEYDRKKMALKLLRNIKGLLK